MTYTCFGLFNGILTPLFFAVEGYMTSKWLWSLSAVLISLVSFATLFVGYQVEPAIGCYGAEHGQAILFGLAHSFGYLRFVSLMLANFFAIKGTSILPTLCGAIILAVLLISFGLMLCMLFRKDASWAKRLIPAALLSY